MKLTLSQCKADNESAALRGLRRSLRSSYSSSSSSSSSRSIQQHLEALPNLQCTPIYSVATSASVSVKPEKPRRVKLARKKEEIVLSSTLEEESGTSDKSKASIRRQRSLDLTLTRRSNLPKTLCRTSSCTTIGRKRVIGFDDHEYNSTSCFSSDLEEDDEDSPRKRFASPKTPSSCLDRSPSASSSDLSWWSANPETPSTPSLLDFSNEKRCIGGDSLLEDLPFDILIHIVCCLEHDNLKPVSQVCKRLFQAVSTAWQNHFCFTTPRREKKGLKFELFPEEPRAEAAAFGNQGVGMLIRPPTPQAPRQPPRPTEARLKELSEICPFAPSMSADADRMKPLSLSSHRVLFSEDELCQAVAGNTLS